ncbi:MAG: cell division protein FtsA [Candidatus Andersenbacteria bacterium]|nr:cell division protein FtsA [Candidatus Andersenbacteria bacterium]MBI3251024.1 cell division protein FtsA [Candidatus Andersenbacteria bacterium]
MSRIQKIAGIDAGTSKVRVIVAQKDPESGQIVVSGSGIAPMAGMQRGVITDIEEATKAVSSALDAAERVAGFPVEQAYVSINGPHLHSQNSRGVIAVGRADGEIASEDIDRVINAAQAISLPANREILHVLPQNFIVDGQEHIQDPIGMTGVRLEVETHVIEGSAPFIKNLAKVVNQSGVHIEDFVFAPLAAAQAVLEKRQKELGVVLIDMGAGTTSLAIFEDKSLLHTAVLPVGSAHITNDIAIGLRTSIEVAEEIKIQYGTALPGTIKGNDSIVIDDGAKDGGESHKVSRKEVAEIIGARLEEIFSFVDKELKAVGRSGLLPAGAVITGGGAHLPGLVEVAKKRLRLPARIGRPQNIGGVIDQAGDPAFAVALGLIAWAIEQESRTPGRTSMRIPNIGKTVTQVRDWFRTFLP